MTIGSSLKSNFGAAGPDQPCTIRFDQGSQFTSKELDLWAYANGIALRPGKSTDNAFVEGFDASVRLECRGQHWFMDLDDANLHEIFSCDATPSGIPRQTEVEVYTICPGSKGFFGDSWSGASMCSAYWRRWLLALMKSADRVQNHVIALEGAVLPRACPPVQLLSAGVPPTGRAAATRRHP